MRIVSYNILDGGTGRLDGLADTLAHLNGDFVGLCEAQFPDAVAQLGRKLGLQALTAEAVDGKHHVALLTRLSVERVVNLSGQLKAINRGALSAVVRGSHGPVRCVVAHLSSGQNAEDEPKRVHELRALLGHLDHLDEDPMPTVLMGDLNAAAPYHPFDYNASSPRVKERLARRHTQRLDHDAIRVLMDAGWTDCHLHAHPEDHTPSFTTEFPCARFDYIWVTDGLRPAIRDAGVGTGAAAAASSDHYPVWAEVAA